MFERRGTRSAGFSGRELTCNFWVMTASSAKSSVVTKPTSNLSYWRRVSLSFTWMLAALLIVVWNAAQAQAPPRPQRKGDKTSASTLPATQAEIERGKYLVNNVAMCPQCHTPRLADGSLDRGRPLDGAPELFQPPNPDPNWPLMAPRIGGNPPASDGDLVKLLTTGNWTDGQPLRLPMMPFRMNEADAKAVVAYLHSVKQEH